MKKVYLGLILIMVLTIIGCGSSGGSTDNTSDDSISDNNISGTIQKEQYTVESDDSVNVSSDVTIESETTIDINGNLIADGDKGQNITLRAVGDINISGSITSGDGGDTKNDGGTITLISETGNITLGSGSKVNSGSGKDGAVYTVGSTPTKGSTGGSVVLQAQNGTVTIPVEADAIKLGNGGDGTDVEVQGEDLLTTEIASDISHDGGDSGTLDIQAIEIVGLTFERNVLLEDIVDENEPTIILLAGTVIDNVVQSIDGQIAGGEGGDGGDFIWGVDENDESTYPDDEEALSSARIKATKSNEELIKNGAKGGDGLRRGGDGGNIKSTASNGTSQGADGQAISVTGGKGGNCDYNGLPGDGGNAIAVGGNGANGGPSGGKGGDAHAVGGNPGVDKYSFFDDNKIPLGTPGKAHAIGGNGGNGGNFCDGSNNGIGGSGGFGGMGNARIDYYHEYGENIVIAHGGYGGDGGDGSTEGGDGGIKGNAFIHNNFAGSYKQDGQAGRDGSVCPNDGESEEPAEEPTTTCDYGSATLTYLATGWSDCQTESGVHSTLESLGVNVLHVGNTYTEQYGDGSGCSFTVDSCD